MKMRFKNNDYLILISQMPRSRRCIFFIFIFFVFLYFCIFVFLFFSIFVFFDFCIFSYKFPSLCTFLNTSADFLFYCHKHFDFRSSKWFVSLEEYPFDRWPPYVTAGI